MLYLFMDIFKLINFRPGENSNCLPGVKVDDNGKERGGRPRGRERYWKQVREMHQVKVRK